MTPTLLITGRSLCPKSVYKPPSDKRSKVTDLFDYLSVLTRTDVEVIVQNCLTKRTNSLLLQIARAVEFTFEVALQASYFNSKNRLRSAMLQVIEQALSHLVRSDCAPTVSRAEMRSLYQAKAVVDTIVQSVLSKMGFIV